MKVTNTEGKWHYYDDITVTGFNSTWKSGPKKRDTQHGNVQLITISKSAPVMSDNLHISASKQDVSVRKFTLIIFVMKMGNVAVTKQQK